MCTNFEIQEVWACQKFGEKVFIGVTLFFIFSLSFQTSSIGPTSTAHHGSFFCCSLFDDRQNFGHRLFKFIEIVLVHENRGLRKWELQWPECVVKVYSRNISMLPSSILLEAKPSFFSAAVWSKDFFTSTCILSSSWLPFWDSSSFTLSLLDCFNLGGNWTPSHVGPYSPRRLTPLRSPRGKTALRKVKIRPQNIVLDPIFDSLRRRSFKVRRTMRALPFWGTIPSVSRSARDSIHENMWEQDAMVWVSSRSWRVVKGNVDSQASETRVSVKTLGIIWPYRVLWTLRLHPTCRTDHCSI